MLFVLKLNSVEKSIIAILLLGKFIFVVLALNPVRMLVKIFKMVEVEAEGNARIFVYINAFNQHNDIIQQFDL